jgi:arylsulfatase A-like enzyme
MLVIRAKGRYNIFFESIWHNQSLFLRGGSMFIPWHALAIFALQLGLRGFQILRLSQEQALPQLVWVQLPWLLWPDALTALLAGILWDWGETSLGSRFPAARRFTWVFSLIFISLVMYLGFSISFYSQFEDFFNYGFWTQVDRLSSFWKPIVHEIGLGSIIGITALLAYALSVRMLAQHWPRLGTKHPRLQLLGFALAAIWILSFSPWQHGLPAANWHALDKNPLKELVSFLVPEPAAAAPRKLKTPPVKPSGLKKFATIPLAERQNLSVLFIIMESTTPEYAGITRATPAGLTPNLMHLASTSLVFTNHYCQEPATLKSWYSLLTGRYSYATRRWQDFIARAKPDPSLPEILKPHGYRTVFLTSSNGRTYSQNDFLQGRFDEVEDMHSLKKLYPIWQEYSDCLDDRVLPDALDNFLQQNPGKKFLAVVSPYFPHHPYAIPDPVYQITPGKTDFERYQNSLHFADYLIGQLTGVLARNRRDKDTVVVLVSDHGEAFRQHPGNTLHSVYLYEENVRTLFLLHCPRLLPPGRVADITRHIDVLPTILDLLGYASPGCDGESAVSQSGPQTAYFYTTFSDPRFGLRCGEKKYLYNRRSGAEESYNLNTDPGEIQNLAPISAEYCAQKRRELDNLEEKIR